MEISGLQKLTLLDYPGRTACTVFLSGCNYRCPFCHNAALVLRPGELGTMSEEKFFAFLAKRHGLLDGVCVTGGEPTLRPELPEFLSRIKQEGFLVKLDTNGSDPDMLAYIIEKGLCDYVAMDIKASPGKYALACGLANYAPFRELESIRILRESSVEYEFRTTVVEGLHEPEDFEQIGKLIEGAPRYFLQGFVDSGDILCPGMTACSKEKMLRMLETAQKYVPGAQLRGID